MASPISAGLVKVEFRYTWNNELCENVFHVQLQAPPVELLDLETLGTSLQTWWEDNLMGGMSDNCTLREIYMETYGGSEGSIAHTQPVALDGTHTAESLPNNVALSISFRTQFIGRSRRGRIYTPGMTIDHSEGTYATDAYVEILVDAYSVLMTVLEGIGWKLVVASFISNGNPRVSALQSVVTSIVAVDKVLDSQKRRLPGRGS